MFLGTFLGSQGAPRGLSGEFPQRKNFCQGKIFDKNFFFHNFKCIVKGSKYKDMIIQQAYVVLITL